jgi:hypothetical protein
LTAHARIAGGASSSPQATAGQQLSIRRVSEMDLVAEGDAVVARFVLEVTPKGGAPVSASGLTYYRMAGGLIVEDEPFTRPDLVQVLGLTPPGH